MAETLGSLADKLTIKSIREFYITKMLRSKKKTFGKKSLAAKLNTVQKQKRNLCNEIEEYILLAASGRIPLKDEKLKLYNKPQLMGKTGNIKTLSTAIDALGKKNLELWHLEDEARREDKPLTYIGTVKRKIDKANQQRNDLIDKIDDLFSALLKTRKRTQ